MKKLLLIISMIMLLSISSTLATITFEYTGYDEDSATVGYYDVLAFECATPDCSSLIGNPLTTEDSYAANNQGDSEIIFDTNYGTWGIPEQDVILYFFRDGYLPTAETQYIDTDEFDANPMDGLTAEHYVTEQVTLTKKGTCDAILSDFTVPNEINFEDPLTVTVEVESAFSYSNFGVYPLGGIDDGTSFYDLFHDLYEAETNITVNVYDIDHNFVTSDYHVEEIPADETFEVEFEFDLDQGEYYVEVVVEVVDNACDSAVEYIDETTDPINVTGYTLVVNHNGPYVASINDVIAMEAEVYYAEDLTMGDFTVDWDFGDANSETGIVNGNIHSVSHAYTTTGTFTIDMTVTDQDTGDVTVFQTDAIITSQAPVAEAGPDVYGDINIAVEFDGSASYDDVDATSDLWFYWDYGDGGFDYVQGLTNPTYTYTLAGTYTVTLYVYDSDNNVGTDFTTAYISVNNAPVVDAGPDVYTFVGIEAEFSATVTDDNTAPEDLYYYWDFNTDGTPNLEDYDLTNPLWIYNVPATRTVTLCVEDTDGAIGCDTTTAYIDYSALTVSITAAETLSHAPFTTNLEAVVSGGLAPYTIEWDWETDGVIDDNDGDEFTAFTIATPGVVTTTVHITDSLSNTVEATIELEAVDTVSAIITADPESGEPELFVQFDASDSTGYGQLSYSWDLNGDGVEDSDNAQVSAWFRHEGNYDVTLTITDELGGEAIATKTIRVSESVTNDNDPRRNVYIAGISFLDDEIQVKAGDWLPLHVVVENIGDLDRDNMKISATIQELGVYSTTTEFEFNRNDDEARTIYLEIPEWTVPGWYDVRITISDDFVRRVRYRDILIIE
jgi:PKD repeat protein